METDITLNVLNKEVSIITNISNRCKKVLEKDEGYKSLSLKQLSEFYRNIENGLISYNLIKKRYSNEFKEIVNEIDTWDFEKTLEASLLDVAMTITLKDSSHLLSKMFKESLWNEKLKNKEYYEEICEYLDFEEKNKEEIYNYLCN